MPDSTTPTDDPDTLADMAPLKLPLRVTGAPNAEIIGILREALADAEAGTLIAVGIAVVQADGSMACAYHRGQHWSDLLACVATLQDRVIKEGT